MVEALTPLLLKIIQNNKLDVIGYAFQIYALFVAHTAENNPVFQTLTQSIVTTPGNWAHDMRYLMPSQASFLVAMICRHTEFMKQYIPNLV